MKESYHVEIINTKGIMSSAQQAKFRNRLKKLLEREEIISVCVDDRSLFIEYNPNTLNKASLKNLLREYSSSLNELIVEQAKEFHIV